MDRNYDDSISFDELFLFLFPDHDVALAREKKRLKAVGDRVQRYGGITKREDTNRSVRPNSSAGGRLVLAHSGSTLDGERPGMHEALPTTSDKELPRNSAVSTNSAGAE